MNKVKEIATAWKNVITSTDEVKELGKARMEVCNTCPKKIMRLNVDVCGDCGCPLVAKTLSPVNSCPKNKWIR